MLAKDGSTVWEQKLPKLGYTVVPLVNGGKRLYAVSGGHAIAFGIENGEVQKIAWQTRLTGIGASMSSICLGPNGIMYVGCGGCVAGLRGDSGELLWCWRLAKAGLGLPAVLPVKGFRGVYAACGPRMVVLKEDGGIREGGFLTMVSGNRNQMICLGSSDYPSDVHAHPAAMAAQATLRNGVEEEAQEVFNGRTGMEAAVILDQLDARDDEMKVDIGTWRHRKKGDEDEVRAEIKRSSAVTSHGPETLSMGLNGDSDDDIYEGIEKKAKQPTAFGERKAMGAEASAFSSKRGGRSRGNRKSEAESDQHESESTYESEASDTEEDESGNSGHHPFNHDLDRVAFQFNKNASLRTPSPSKSRSRIEAASTSPDSPDTSRASSPETGDTHLRKYGTGGGYGAEKNVFMDEKPNAFIDRPPIGVQRSVVAREATNVFLDDEIKNVFLEDVKRISMERNVFLDDASTLDDAVDARARAESVNIFLDAEDEEPQHENPVNLQGPEWA